MWEENWPAIKLFTQVSTQWRIGAAGPVGLDYAVVFHELDRRGVVGDAFDEMMGSIRVIEGQALSVLQSPP